MNPEFAPAAAAAAATAAAYAPYPNLIPSCDPDPAVGTAPCGQSGFTALKTAPSIVARYFRESLVSTVAGIADQVEFPALQNPGGAILVNNILWVANTNTASMTAYSAQYETLGQPLGVFISTIIPFPSAIICNPTDCFAITSDALSHPANVIGVTLEGGIFAINTKINTTKAIVVKMPRIPSPNQASVYTGITIVKRKSGSYLYVTDFKNRQIAVFNSSFALVKTLSNNDPTLMGYGPVSICAIGSTAYVGYAQQDEDAIHPINGTGILEQFCLKKEKPIKRLLMSPDLNIPSSIISLNGYLAVANYGSGQIILVDRVSGQKITEFRNPRGRLIELTFVRSILCAQNGIIWYVSAINAGQDGLIGVLHPC